MIRSTASATSLAAILVSLTVGVGLAPSLSGAAFAQAIVSPPPPGSPQVPAEKSGPPLNADKGCDATASASATAPAKGENSGTAPGGAGSTGWSGGTGGSFIGTQQSGATSGSPTDHPATVEGVNPSVVGPTRKDC
ncbi:hypothetical protein [Roseixanthobacter glucoisosaccharinicivorans]|uniref:hypothetical protein n=1 Tax=Roseixanthobacter glucoisosaccharinicivorans TaxID=3119923 RepID=UPI003729B90B